MEKHLIVKSVAFFFADFCHQMIEFHSYNSGAYTSKYKYGTTSITETVGTYWECDCNPDCAGMCSSHRLITLSAV